MPPITDTNALRFQAVLLSASGQAVVATDMDGRITHWNVAAVDMYGWTVEEAMGGSAGLVAPTHSAERPPELRARLSAGQKWTGDYCVRHKDGHIVPVLVTDTPVIEEGKLVAIISVSSDISERERAEETTSRLAAIVESSGDAIFGVSLEGTITSWNHGAEMLYGYTEAEALGSPATMLASPDRLDEVTRMRAAVGRGETTSGLETIRRCKDGSMVEVSSTVSPVRDRRGAVVARSAIERDITARRTMERDMHYAAMHDLLTGLPNRTLVGDRLSLALSRSERSGASVAVLFLDIDHFKNINNAVGHETGDEVLIEVAQRITRAMRPSDTVARFGGDEFVIICENADALMAESIAARVLGAFAEPMEVAEQTTYVTASIGIAIAKSCTDPETLLRHADAAMYDAKARGRARTSMFSEALGQLAHEQLELSTALREAIESDALQVHYQPIIEITTGQLIGVEALCRWNHATLGWVSPAQFVRIAEETGLVGLLDRWVLRRATADTRTLRDAGVISGDARVAINISACNVADSGLELAVREAAGAAGIPYTSLALEVTETGVMADPEGACAVLASLQALGVRIKIDDFGTGYSSLTYLRRLPIGAIKIDRDFIGRMTHSPDELAIVSSIIDLGRAVHVKTIAEGLETPEQLSLLHQLGCWAGQGFLWSPALPLAELITLAHAHREGRFATVPTRRRAGRRRAPVVTVAHGITRIVQMHHLGASPSTIAAALNQEGFRTPSGHRWHQTSVARAVADLTYAMAPAA